MRRAVMFAGCLLLAGCFKSEMGGSCSSDFGCGRPADKCLRVNGKDQDGVCSKRCNGPTDCTPETHCARVPMSYTGGVMGKLGAGGSESWCMPN